MGHDGDGLGLPHLHGSADDGSPRHHHGAAEAAHRAADGGLRGGLLLAQAGVLLRGMASG